MRVFFLFLHFTCASFLFGQAPNSQAGLLKKLSPGAMLYLNHSEDVFLFPAEADGRVRSLVQVKDQNIPFGNTVVLHSEAGQIRSVSLNVIELLGLMEDENVAYVDLAWRLTRVRMLNDTARIMSQVNEVHAGTANGLPQDYLGTGVVVGIVDIGFQPDNPTFYNADGSATRIRRWWHQSDKSGSKPAGFSYGTEYSAIKDILAAKDDDGTHGTHVGGIAAGSGFSTPALKYKGMAPDADLAFVTIKYANDTVAGSALGDYVVANPTIIDGYNYIFNYAASVSKPAVCNLSWGMHTGPHDGSSLFDKAVESITGKGKIICGAAGNDGGKGMHVGAVLSLNTMYTYAYDASRKDYDHESVYIDGWGSTGKAFGMNVSLFDTLGNKLIETPFHYGSSGAVYKKPFANGSDTVWVTVAANPSFVNNGKPEVLMMLETNNAKKQRIRIGFTGSGQFHAWNSGQVYRWTSGGFTDSVQGTAGKGKYLQGTQAFSVSENGGTGKAVITSGSYVARKEWVDFNGVYRSNNWLNPGEVSGFSSRGPSADNAIKPDVISPGQNVGSAINYRTFSPWMAEITPLKTSFLGQDQYWTLFSGTSMASPHTTGIVALLLQIKPDLTPQEIMGILKATAKRDVFTGADSNIHAGYGKINALAAVKRLFQLQMENPVLSEQIGVYPNPTSQMVRLTLPAAAGKNVQVTLYTATGAKVISQNLAFDAFGVTQFQTADYPAGIYVLSTETSTGNSSSKLVITR